ncbi:MAG: trimethylamine methyltransferase family protein [Clostridiales bacterium]
MKFEILSPEDKALVHKKSLELLKEVGIKVDSEKILKLMADNGCEVDFDKQLIKFPDKIIEDAVKIAPHKFVLGALNKEKDMYLGEGNSYICTDGQGCFVGDWETGERRISKMEDLVNAAKIAEATDYIRCFWPIITAHDVPDGTRIVHEMVESFKVSTLHFESDCYNTAQADCYKKVLHYLFDEETLLNRPPLSLVCCPVTPLTFEGPMAEGTISMGEINTPVVILPMPIAGTTAPMSLFSTVIQNNAEVLAGNAIFQTANPGRKVIYGAAPGILDMATSLFCVGSAEGALQNAACTEMGKYYNLPTMACFGCDAPTPGEQSGTERGIACVTLFMAGADILTGVGLTGSAQILYLEELILNEDILNMCRRVSEGIRTGEEHSLTDLVKEIGPGGNFLAESSTVEYLKNGEHLHIKHLSRDSYEGWRLNGKKGELEMAAEKITSILAEHKQCNFTEEQIEGLREIMDKADKEIFID